MCNVEHFLVHTKVVHGETTEKHHRCSNEVTPLSDVVEPEIFIIVSNASDIASTLLTTVFAMANDSHVLAHWTVQGSDNDNWRARRPETNHGGTHPSSRTTSTPTCHRTKKRKNKQQQHFGTKK